mgnify:CR=1 FL=1
MLELPQGLDILNIFFQILGISTPIIYTEIKEKKNKESKVNKVEKTVVVNFRVLVAICHKT